MGRGSSPGGSSTSAWSSRALPARAAARPRALAVGFRPLWVEAADAFESGFLADAEEWLLTHPDHVRAEAVRACADDHRQRWLHGYRNNFGFGYMTLGRPKLNG
ncbi:hypothetical protein [Actinoplanes sp. NPDC026670]|uniref:hypothetical protein n=1 Tax=Actinoplanes sp. NPDC026670 TaxID=3154700 RepID=UPI0033DBBA3E